MRLFRAPASMSRFAACGPAPRLFCKTSPLEIRLERRPRRRSPTKVRSCRQSRGVIRGARDRNDQSTQRGSLAMIRSLETRADNPSALIGAMRSVAAVLDKIPQSLISLAARIFPAAVLLMSEQTKVEGFHVTDNAIAFFAPNTPFHGSFWVAPVQPAPSDGSPI